MWRFILAVSLALLLVQSTGWAQDPSAELADEEAEQVADTAPDETAEDWGGCGGRGLEVYLADVPASPPDDAAVNGLRHMRLLEKAARDTYLSFGESYDLRVFHRIARAEQHHMDHLAWLFARYEVEDPVADDAPGAFADEEVGALYASWVAQGQISQEAALRAAAGLEELDILDLEEVLAAEPGSDVAMVYQNLLKGSRNHVRALQRAMTNQGVDYTPQHLTQARWDEIAVSEPERGVMLDAEGAVVAECQCGGHGQHGQGRGQGSGRGAGRGHGHGGGNCRGGQ